MEWWVTIAGLGLARTQRIFPQRLTSGQRFQTLVWQWNLVYEESDKLKYFPALQTWYRGWTWRECQRMSERVAKSLQKGVKATTRTCKLITERCKTSAKRHRMTTIRSKTNTIRFNKTHNNNNKEMKTKTCEELYSNMTTKKWFLSNCLSVEDWWKRTWSTVDR